MGKVEVRMWRKTGEIEEKEKNMGRKCVESKSTFKQSKAWKSTVKSLRTVNPIHMNSNPQMSEKLEINVHFSRELRVGIMQ